VKRPKTTLQVLLAQYERMIIVQTFAQNGFSRKQTADALGVSRQYLWARVIKLKIDRSVLPRAHPGRPRKKFSSL
jgi:DNA-binding NtrC family response regulator